MKHKFLEQELDFKTTHQARASTKDVTVYCQLKDSVCSSGLLMVEMTMLRSCNGAVHNTITSGFLALRARQQKDQDKDKQRDTEAGERRQLNTVKTGIGGNTKDKTLKITQRRKVGKIVTLSCFFFLG